MSEPSKELAVEEIADSVLATVFPDTLQLARRYASLLVEEGIPRGLLGPREAAVVWSRHILNCAVVGELIPDGAELVDVGSGAGLPGIPLALACPNSRVTLVEPLLRRSTWLTDTVRALQLDDRIRVVRGRIEEQSGRVKGDVVTARAVASLDKLVTWCRPAVRDQGQMLALRGERAAEDLDSASDTLRRHAARGTVFTCGSTVVSPPTTVVGIRFNLLRASPRSPRLKGAL